MQEQILKKLIFARIHAGPVFALARIQKICLRDHFPRISQNSWGTSFRCEYMSRLYSHPHDYSKNLLASYLCIGFMPGGMDYSTVTLHCCFQTHRARKRRVVSHLAISEKHGGTAIPYSAKGESQHRVTKLERPQRMENQGRSNQGL